MKTITIIITLLSTAAFAGVGEQPELSLSQLEASHREASCKSQELWGKYRALCKQADTEHKEACARSPEALVKFLDIYQKTYAYQLPALFGQASAEDRTAQFLEEQIRGRKRKGLMLLAEACEKAR